MSMALPVQGAVEVDDAGIDPRVRTPIVRLGAGLDDAGESGIEGDAVRILDHPPPEALGNVEGIQREQAAQLGIDKE
jgi:hypothetical protein